MGKHSFVGPIVKIFLWAQLKIWLNNNQFSSLLQYAGNPSYLLFYVFDHKVFKVVASKNEVKLTLIQLKWLTQK